MEDFEQQIRDAIESVNNGDPLKDFLNDYKVVEALEYLLTQLDMERAKQ